MTTEKIEFLGDEYKRRALEVAGLHLPPITTCTECGSPCVEGRICTFCGNPNGGDDGLYEPMTLDEIL